MTLPQPKTRLRRRRAAPALTVELPLDERDNPGATDGPESGDGALEPGDGAAETQDGRAQAGEVPNDVVADGEAAPEAVTQATPGALADGSEGESEGTTDPAATSERTEPEERAPGDPAPEAVAEPVSAEPVDPEATRPEGGPVAAPSAGLAEPAPQPVRRAPVLPGPRIGRPGVPRHLRPLPDAVATPDLRALQEASIALHDVTMIYPNGRRALSDVDLVVPDGDFVFLVGPSGAGKTTLTRLLLRDETATNGLVFVDGRDVARLTRREVPQLRRRIGIVFQDFKLLPSKTVRENVAFALEVTGTPRERIGPAVERALALVGLSEASEQRPTQLSGGEQQRTAIARAMVHNPRIVIADEPTGNLDPLISWEILKLLLHINELGTTVLIATHNAEVVTALRKRVVALEDGRIVRDEVGGYRREY